MIPTRWPEAVVRRATRSVKAGFSGRERSVVATRPGHAFLTVRGLHGSHAEAMAHAVEESLSKVRGVHWASVNPVLASVVVSFEDGQVDVQDLAGIVGGIEDAHGLSDDDLPDVPEHPADTVPISRAVTALGADAVGFGVSLAGRVVRAPALPVEIASAVTVLDAFGPVRRVLDRRPRVATGAALLNAALQGLGQGPLGPVVDGAHRVAVLGELTARRQAWLDAEDRLCGFPAPEAAALEPVGDRPEPLPRTLVERYTQTGSLATLGGAALTLITTANPQRAADVLLAGVPRAARLGVEVFGAQIGRTLAGRQAVVMDSSVLRRLDLVDTVVIDAGLFESEDDGVAPEAFVDSVRAAAHDLVVATDEARPAPGVDADFTVPGVATADSVRRLQAEGRVVLLISHRGGTALRAADVGVGVVQSEQVPPWGADVLCLDPAGVAAVVHATRLARTAGRQAAALAAAGSAAGGLMVLGPLPGAGRRAVTAVQLAALAAMGAGVWTGRQLPAPPRQPQPSDSVPVPWHSVDTEEVMAALGSDPNGLSPADAESRFAPESDARGPSFGGLVVKEMANPLTAVLGAGAALSAATGSVVDAALIGGALGINAAIGAAQRLRTESAISRLGEALAGEQATVVRSGRPEEVPVTAVVPGDVLQLAAGDTVPADCRIVEAVGLEVDESSLTGESFPVVKQADPVSADAAVADRQSMLYAGTALAAGRARAVVVATGSETEARRGDAAIEAPVTGVQTRLRKLTDRTVPLVLAAGAGLTLNGLLRGAPVREAVSSGVSLGASAVPEGLPFVATVAQAAASQRLASSDVLVRNPQVLEALGRVDVLCFDKTGTLTTGHLSVSRVSDGDAEQPLGQLDPGRQRVVAAALRATPRARSGGLPHPTDQAVVEGAAEAGVRPNHGVPGWKKMGSLPFEPGRGYHVVAADSRDGGLLSVKGAPEVVLPRCSSWRRPDGATVRLESSARGRLEEEADRLAREGLRVLAVAERNGTRLKDPSDEDVKDLELVGFLGISDEARSAAARPLSRLIKAGIRIIMITGDHPSTAEAVASDLGLLNGRGVLTGPDLDAMNDEQLDAAVEGIAVFARVTPAHKVRIVESFQRAGRVVAMTGDGANDAQAIRLAHVGVAFGSRSTPAAQGAADIVIARDDLDGLIQTMVEGRAMWASVREALAILLGGNLGEVMFTAGGAVLTGRSPLRPRQLLVVNLFTDLVPAMAIAAQPPRFNRVQVEKEGPETSLSGPLARDVAIRAVATSVGAYGAWVSARLTGSPARARTVGLAALVVTQLGQTIVIGRHSPLVVGSALLSAVGLAAVIQTPGISQFFECTPLGPLGWGTALASAGVATAGSVLADVVIP